jgi:predicted hydrocarbon binding protein
MALTKLTFNVDEVERLQTKIKQVSQDTNRLYLQLKGQASNWGGIPLGANQMKAQVLVNELMVEAEKLEDIIRLAVKGVQSAQDENKRQANQLFQQFGTLGGMFGKLGGGSASGQFPIPTYAQKMVTKLITSVAALMGRDELKSDPLVQKLQTTVKNSGLGTIDSIAAHSKLKDIYQARDQIAKAQTAYKVYQAFGNKAQMDAMHKLAEDARKKLESLGVDAVQYQAGKDLGAYFKQPAVKACDYDPSITTSSVPLMEKEEYAFLLRMAVVEGSKGEWAKQQLELMKPQATIGPVNPFNAVSEADILNRDDPKVIERLKGTYWFKLSVEEQDRRFAEVKAYYEKQGKEAADKNRLLGSGVGNQTLANILVGGSNMVVHAIDTASFGMAGTVTDWIMGPEPEGYVDPLDNQYGKKAGQFLGTVVSIGLPVKYLNAIKTGGAVGKFSPTLLRSMVAGAVSGTVGEAFDAFNDYRGDGKQNLGERITAVGINTVIAGAGDALITAGSKLAVSAVRFVSGKLPTKATQIENGVKGAVSDAGGFNKGNLKDISGFTNEINSLLSKHNISLGEFNDLRLKDVSLLSNSEKIMVKSIRESIPMPDNTTIMQKVIPNEDISKYLEGTYSQVGGYITKASDVTQLEDYMNIYKSLRLDYTDTKFNAATDEVLGVIRFKTPESSNIKIPYSNEMGGIVSEPQPFTGNGFTKATNGQSIPEYKCDGYLSLFDGAELYTVSKKGSEVLLATYDVILGQFIKVNP